MAAAGTDGDRLDRQPAHDLAAEQAVLGAMLTSPAACHDCLQALVPGDFYRPAHQLVFEAAAALSRAGNPADPVTVADRMASAGTLRRAGGTGYLHTLYAAVPAPASAGYYAGIVRDRAIRRRLAEAGARICQLASGYSDDGAHGLAEAALREVEAVRDAGLGDGFDVQDIGEFLDAGADDDAYDWVIPGLLERGDRMIITGMEGAGKTTVLAQIAVCAAAGVHPFTGEAITPVRVFFLDCENGPSHTRRKLRPLVAQARLQCGRFADGNLWVQCRPEGLDLALDKDTSALLRKVAVIRPDLVLLGPLYRLAPRALNSDDDAAPLIAALNMVRALGACILLEAHAGHAPGPGGKRDLRPRGSSAFLGWPEFGYGIRWADGELARRERTVDMVPWRGDRDERDWPQQLTAGGTWPWRACQPRRAADDWGPS